MSANRPLTVKEVAFCRAYVDNGGNAKQAAITAGYSQKTAASQASRLLKSPAIQAELERLRGAPQAVVNELIDRALTVVRQDRPEPGTNPERAAMYAEAEADIAAGLQRAYVIAGLIENFEICLGRRATKVTKIEKHARKDADGNTEVVWQGTQIETYGMDPAGAARTGEILLKECDRMEGKGGLLPEETREHSLDEMVIAFAEQAGMTIDLKVNPRKDKAP